MVRSGAPARATAAQARGNSLHEEVLTTTGAELEKVGAEKA